jgi:hypothetical protein
MHRRLMAFAFVAAACSPAFAQSLPPSVIACSDEPDSLKRLVCYDKEVGRYRKTAPVAATPPAPPPPANALPPASSPSTAHATPPPVAASATPPATSPSASFGSNAEIERKAHPAAEQPPAVNMVTVRIASVSFKGSGETVMTLDNGQVWEETEHESHIPLHAGEEVTIKKGVLGAFYLSSPEVRGMRVKRVK